MSGFLFCNQKESMQKVHRIIVKQLDAMGMRENLRTRNCFLRRKQILDEYQEKNMNKRRHHLEFE